MPYEQLLREGKIRRHQLNPRELRHQLGEFLAVATRSLKDGSIEQISYDGRHNHGYDAARAAAEALMMAEGYRRGPGPDQHILVFEFLKLVDNGRFIDEAQRFNDARKLRNKTTYERSGVVSESTALVMLRRATRFLADVRQWIAEHHPDLIEPASIETPSNDTDETPTGGF